MAANNRPRRNGCKRPRGGFNLLDRRSRRGVVFRASCLLGLRPGGASVRSASNPLTGSRPARAFSGAVPPLPAACLPYTSSPTLAHLSRHTSCSRPHHFGPPDLPTLRGRCPRLSLPSSRPSPIGTDRATSCIVQGDLASRVRRMPLETPGRHGRLKQPIVPPQFVRYRNCRPRWGLREARPGVIG